MQRIRGVYASASLKRSAAHPARTAERRIRGVYASASLKLFIRRRGLLTTSCIRGVYASASLKLIGYAEYCSRVEWASEVFTPRPH